ncbi:MAG TPA: site-specific integrase [Acidimicrobiales bacterium]|nr:site-specific integrase [Acidimicrobiales bacterium]
MQGRVFRRRGKAWAYVVDVGRDAANGRRVQYTKGGFATRKEAEAALRDTLGAVERGTHVSRSPATLAEYLQEWLVTVKPRLRPTTWYSYALAVARMVAVIGATRLQAVTPLQIERMYAQLLENGGARGQALAPKTVRNCHTVLHRALSDAERLGLVARNAAHAAKGPAVERKEMATWTAEELAGFLDFVAGERLYAAYVLLATTGMRRGEVFGLRWSDVDLDGRRLSVSQTVTTIGNQVFLGPTKTPRSRRSVSLDADTVSVLRAHRKRQAEERMATGLRSAGRLVFGNVDGSALNPDLFTIAFKRRVKESGLPELRGPHGLRHTWVISPAHMPLRDMSYVA